MESTRVPHYSIAIAALCRHWTKSLQMYKLTEGNVGHRRPAGKCHYLCRLFLCLLAT